MRHALLVLMAGAFLALAATASAQPTAADPVGPPPLPSPYPPVRWKDEWPRFSVAEALISVAVTFRNADLGVALDGPHSATIEGQVPILDPGLRDLLRAKSASRRKGAARLSDMGFR